MKLRLLASLLALVGSVFAAEPPPDSAARVAELQKIAAGLNYRQGTTVIGNGLAKISVPEKFRYLDAKDTDAILVKLWGNPQASGTLGALVPAGFNPLAGDGWLAVITYDEDGYVKDNDAASIDYTKMLADMQAGMKEANEERQKQGYQPIQLVGWAKPPRYDAAAHKLYWAKELKFGNAKEHTLNYNIRMLGRRGVLVINAVATMPELPEVEAATPALLSMVDFQEGHRYADFNTDTDKVATYGLAALVAGGIAAKAGFFKLLWVGILAFKKIIIVAAIAAAGYFKKLWDKIRGRSAAVTLPSTTNNPPAPPVNPA
jgi:uncharacterized membrane-anchored protein